MKNEYEYILFVKLTNPEKPRKTDSYWCINKKSGDSLGAVKWWGAWRQYCYFPSLNSLYSSGCLTNISNFVDNLNKKRQEEIKLKKQNLKKEKFLETNQQY